MGTKLQCESYQLGYSSMRNLNEDSSSSWSPYYEDKSLNEHLFNGFMLRPEHSGFDKEMLKQTMLEHEATFRKQVCELHRLYRTQKDLMDELKNQELYKLPVQNGISQSYLFSSAMASETNGKIWRMSHMTEASAGFNKASVEGTDDVKPSLDLLEENYMWFSQMPRENGVSLKDGELSDSKLKGRPRKMIDLQLPADVYIDVEDSDRIEKEHIFTPFSKVSDNSSIICDIERENDVKLTLGTREDCSKGSWSSDRILQNGQSTQRLDYRTETKKGLTCEGQSGSVPNHFLSVKPNREEVHGYQLPTRSTRSFLPRDFFADKDRDEGACSDFFDPDKGIAGQEWQSFNYEDGRKRNRVNKLFTLGLSSEKCPMVSEPLELKVKREENVPSYDHGEMQTRFGEKPTLGIGSYQKGSPLVDSNNSALTNSQVPGPSSIIPCAEYMSCAPPVVSTRRKPPRGITHIPIAVQALPCFPASEMTNSRGRKPKGSIQNSTIARNKLQSDGDLNSHPRVGIQLSTCQNGSYQDLWSDSNSSTQFKHSSESSVYVNSESCASRKIPKLGNEVSCSLMLPTGTRENGKLEESSEGVSWPRTKEFSFSKSVDQSPEKFPSSSQVKEGRKQTYGSSHGASTKKILGFPISEKLQQDFIGTSSAGDIKTSIKTEVCDVGTVTAKGTRQSIIDLNILDISTEDEVPSITGKTVHEIDLEVAIPSHETLDMVAAEGLLVMSLGLSQQLASASCNSLHWFADLVSSKAAKADYDDDNGEDVFESSTLKLEEMKPDEYLPLPQEQENLKDETSPGASSLLLTKTLRGQARKRRQRKDFQKDILPGLVSLSRHEVAEDLQAFDCLMRAMGEDWQCNLTRRCTGRKVSGGQGRGRRRPRNLAAAITENCSSPPPTEAVPNPKVELNERSILGWGRTTRRGRRPRVKPGNASLVVS